MFRNSFVHPIEIRTTPLASIGKHFLQSRKTLNYLCLFAEAFSIDVHLIMGLEF
jgi:hypothetical protein